MKYLFALIPLAFLAACQAPGEALSSAENQCNANNHQRLVGTLASNIDKSMLPKVTRIITPGMPVTRDYRPYRLNIYVDAAGKVESVNCG